jgi:hypothetical protein
LLNRILNKLTEEAGVDLVMTGGKHRRHNSDSLPSRSNSPAPAIKRARRIRESTSKSLRISDYEPVAQRVFALAVKSYKAFLSTEEGYPDKLQELTFAKQSWKVACKRAGIEMEHNEEIIKMVCHIICTTSISHVILDYPVLF